MYIKSLITNYLQEKSKAFLFCIVIAIIGYGCTKHGEAERESPHWDYEHPDWQALGYSECDGQIQTPVDIVTSKIIKADLDSVIFNYAPFQMKIVDSGHTVQVNKNGNAVTTMTADGVVYNFLQFHYCGQCANGSKDRGQNDAYHAKG